MQWTYRNAVTGWDTEPAESAQAARRQHRLKHPEDVITRVFRGAVTIQFVPA